MNYFIFLVTGLQIFTYIFAETVCDSDRPCQNAGVCTISILEDQRHSKCLCPDAYHGPVCQYRRCINNFCRNGGICESFGRSFKCHCPPEFEGDFCQHRRPTACDFMDCGNGNCILINNSIDLGVCECDEGFGGPHCTALDPCKPDSCSFHGTCKAHGPKAFSCQCDKGFEGDHCEIDVDECEDNACYPGSKCIDKPGGYECSCPHYRSGVFCQLENPCNNATICGDKGTCFATLTGEYSCLCQEGYTGTNCELDVDECKTGAICGEHGQCVNFPGGYSCECDSGMSGRHCEVPSAGATFYPNQKLIPLVIALVAIIAIFALLICIYTCVLKRSNSGNYKLRSIIPFGSQNSKPSDIV